MNENIKLGSKVVCPSDNAPIMVVQDILQVTSYEGMKEVKRHKVTCVWFNAITNKFESYEFYDDMLELI